MRITLEGTEQVLGRTYTYTVEATWDHIAGEPIFVTTELQAVGRDTAPEDREAWDAWLEHPDGFWTMTRELHLKTEGMLR